MLDKDINEYGSRVDVSPWNKEPIPLLHKNNYTTHDDRSKCRWNHSGKS